MLATPRVVTLAEEATVNAVDGELAEGTTSVGYRVQLDHLAPTAVGGHVRAEATLEAIEGRRLTFRVSVSDGHGLVAAGRITRVIVERARFMEKAAGRLTAVPRRSDSSRRNSSIAGDPGVGVLELRRVAGVGHAPRDGRRARVAHDVVHRLQERACPASPTIPSVGHGAAPPARRAGRAG